ncbi:MAG TPA: glycerol-3-phosphate 1-O-acyltransferase PlsY [Blastocatellia bacterium]|nr:glycerol-3-phosphate 1-O-acyltransferase PlsY [Blastocatellia bacterium]
MTLPETASLILAYLLGSIPVGYLIVKFKAGGDIRSAGSGGTGATNVMRNVGKAAGLATFALDIAKGFLAVMVARLLTGTAWNETTWVVGAAAVVAVIGHIFPVWLGFKAGKGVATGVGVFLAITPLAVICTFLVFVLIVKKTRYVSLGSIIASALTPLWALFWNGLIFPSPFLAQMVIPICGAVALIVFKHTDNIRRLLNGTENKFGAAH